MRKVTFTQVTATTVVTREPASLITNQIAGYRDDDLWDAAVEKERGYTETLVKASERWTEVAEFLSS